MTISNNISSSYRPTNLKEIKDQDHIKRAILRSSLTSTISPCYLFYGPRGTGKTTIARIFPKMFNCTNIQNEEACGICKSCAKFQYKLDNFDVMEIDGASHRKVEDAQEIKRFATSGISDSSSTRFIIIDEAHMLTQEAFNSLLKILEEPPERVTFILITTEYNKLPKPIISRCVTMRFNKITPASIETKIKEILKDYLISASKDTIELISQSSDGCLRDAESILEAALLSREKDGEILYEDLLRSINALSVQEAFWIDSVKTKAQKNPDINIMKEIIKHMPNTVCWQSVIHCIGSHMYNHLLSLNSSSSQIPVCFKKHYSNQKNLYTNKEIHSILSGILATENACNRSANSSKMWTTLLVYKIIKGSYTHNYIDLLKTIVDNNKDSTLIEKKLSNTERTNQEQDCLLEFIKQELK